MSYITQVLSQELSDYLVGKKVTLSILLKDNILRSITTQVDKLYIDWHIIGDDGITRLVSASNKIYFDILYNGDIKAVKLELGTVSTLANDTIPNYQEELIKCSTSTADPNDTYANKPVNFASNKNLLDNPWFTVNQRGQSEYTSTERLWDRWFQYYGLDAVGTYKWSSAGIQIPKDTVMQQFILINDTSKLYTLSMKLSDGNISYATLNIPNVRENDSFSYIFDGEFSAAIRRVDENMIMVMFGRPFYSSDKYNELHIRAVKLEIGTVSTLHLDIAPNYEEEIMKCSTSTVDPTDTYANKPNYPTLISNFQAGVDTIYNACVAAGSTPSDKSPAAIADVINSDLNNFPYTKMLQISKSKAWQYLYNLSSKALIVNQALSDSTVVDNDYYNLKYVSPNYILTIKKDGYDLQNMVVIKAGTQISWAYAASIEYWYLLKD